MIYKFDSQITVKFVQEGVPFTHPYVDLVDSIQSLMYKELQLVLVRTLRKGNENVD
jgi:hypothetical protein